MPSVSQRLSEGQKAIGSGKLVTLPDLISDNPFFSLLQPIIEDTSDSYHSLVGSTNQT